VPDLLVTACVRGRNGPGAFLKNEYVPTCLAAGLFMRYLLVFKIAFEFKEPGTCESSTTTPSR
jgi:hypothetical protein